MNLDQLEWALFWLATLTYAGTHIGLGPTATLENDRYGGPALQAAAALRQALEAHRHQRT